jgi:hypothetical protein
MTLHENYEVNLLPGTNANSISYGICGKCTIDYDIVDNFCKYFNCFYRDCDSNFWLIQLFKPLPKKLIDSHPKRCHHLHQTTKPQILPLLIPPILRPRQPMLISKRLITRISSLNTERLYPGA